MNASDETAGTASGRRNSTEMAATRPSALTDLPADDDGPSFGLALVSVLAGGVVSSWISSLFFTLAPYLGRGAWLVITTVLGAYGVKFVLRLLGYEVGLVAATIALGVGSVVGLVLGSAAPGVAGPGLPLLPAFGMFSGIGSLLLSAWIVQNTAHGDGSR